MGDSSANRGNFGDSGVVDLAGKIIVAATILLFFVIAFVFCLHFYAKRFWYRRQETTTTTSRRRLDFAAGPQERTLVSAVRRGLDPCVLKTMPILIFDPNEFKDELECAVCLCEVSKGEKTRLLPKCNHGFHVDCIDMWFESHSTCPLCRNPVADITQSNDQLTLEDILQAPMRENVESPSFPTNVLFWGDETHVSTFGSCLEEDDQESDTGESSSSSLSSYAGTTSNRMDRALVIDVPRRINEDEEQKSPMPTRLRSLKRLLSGSRRVNPSSPRNLDLEEGGRGES